MLAVKSQASGASVGLWAAARRLERFPVRMAHPDAREERPLRILDRRPDSFRPESGLGRPARGRKPLPALTFFTDPQRTPDPASVIAALPSGAAVVYRAFGAVDAVTTGRGLAAAARMRGVTFLVGADEALATALRADGVHLPERMAGRVRRLRARHPRWLITVAAHSRAALASARAAGADAAVLSPVFPSRSPSAGPPIGLPRAAAWTRGAGLPVIALGGVTRTTARRLRRSGLVGLAVVEALT
jgi:thiamine-phosphate pyrophosphorylase